jgi:hypothetical protein
VWSPTKKDNNIITNTDKVWKWHSPLLENCCNNSKNCNCR